MIRDPNAYVGMPYFMLPEPFGATERTSLSRVATTDRSLEGRLEMYSGIVDAFDCMEEIGRPNVEMIRVNDGAARAPHETCLRQTSSPMIG
jgi:hypothetical protein